MTSNGSYFGPRNYFESGLDLSQAKVDEYFSITGRTGDHVAIIHRWEDAFYDARVREIMAMSRARGFRVVLHLDPLTEYTRAGIVPPAPLAPTFSDPATVQAYEDAVLSWAAHRPDVLGIGTELNLLLWHGNTTEYPHVVAALRRVYAAVKARYPTQRVALSVGWEVAVILNHLPLLPDLAAACDVLALTTYPQVFGMTHPSQMPDNYYTVARVVLPSKPMAVAELGFFSTADAGSSEWRQLEFHGRFKTVIAGLQPEFISQFYLFDQPSFFTADPRFLTMGLRRLSAWPKLSWYAF